MYITPKWLDYCALKLAPNAINYRQMIKTPDFNKKPRVLLAFYACIVHIF
ncbi:hypothetical protein PESP_a0704 [Pseudoalteromonas espejiana DSM 9414]|uniref:Uncharacterized protein n=1 Tax=Pseudoalteromonas espejiana TaxID=28107 RepID=A0A510Y0W3_9GAMM|nr:hypothetical protein PESP_a0704 [Pseudoalteromonas espejiana DSM 9414]GEK56976.1 hypothetical protein PES01_38210 [Pseudoalteromonas espejiana]